MMFDLAIDQRADPLSQIDRRNKQPTIFNLFGISSQIIEELGSIGAEVVIGGEQPQVCVDAGGRRVVVAGGHVYIAAKRFTFATDYQRELTVSLKSYQSVHHVNAYPFKFSCPLNVALFIKAGF